MSEAATERAEAAHGSGVVRIERQGGVALIVIDNPPVNASSQAVRQALLDAVCAADAEADVTAMVIACAGRTFVAGADVREFGRTGLEPVLPQVVQRIEDAGKPVVAALHGTALGGGFEIALGCHARIMAPDAFVGLPEVTLGLIPGAGGTQRLPRLIGMVCALGLITGARRVGAAEALALGIADKVAAGDLRAEAAALAASLAGRPMRRLSTLAVPPFDAPAFDAAVTAACRKARGEAAPAVAAECVRLAAALPFGEGMRREREAFTGLIDTDQSKALRHAFFAEREVARVPRLERVTPRSVRTIGVVGAGTMGAGIAAACADAGFPVTVVEANGQALEAGRSRIAALFARQVKSGRITAARGEENSARVTLSADHAALREADLVIEAAFEDMAVKKEIFGVLARVARPGAVLATNTSYLDVDEIAASHGRGGDTIGLHFFSPATVMRLVEVVAPKAAAREAVATGLMVARKLGKIPVVCGVCEGFVGNRILAVWRAVAEMMLEEGALPQDIDAALEAYGMAMGPFAVSDLAGLDIAFARRRSLEATGPAATRERGRYASAVADRLVGAGRLGQKTGAGWYVYPEGKRTVDPDVTALIQAVSAHKGIVRRPIAADAIVRAVRAAMVNEGARILSEGIVPRALDIDVVLMAGYGFPRWRGGPMFEADRIGLDVILADVRAVQTLAGPPFAPAPLLEDLARSKRRFADLAPA